MAAHPSSGRETKNIGGICALRNWPHLQDSLAEIVGANFSLYDMQGKLIFPPSEITAFCSTLAPPSAAQTSHAETPCLKNAFLHLRRTNHEEYTCLHGLSYWGTLIVRDEMPFGVFIAGPVIVGNRQREDVYREVCEKIGIDAELFCDRIREIRLFSEDRIRIVVQTARHLIECNP